MKQKTLQEQYNLIKEGKGNVEVFMKAAKNQFPNFVRNAATLNETISSLKHNHIISESMLGLGIVSSTKPTTPDWFKIFNENMEVVAEEAKAVEKKPTKDVVDLETKGYDYKDKENVDNVYSEAFLEGYYTEMKDPKNADKSVDELKEIVAKNLAKDQLYYVKDGQFGVKGVGYTTEHPGLGIPKEAKGKYKPSGYGDLKESKINEGYDIPLNKSMKGKLNEISFEEIKSLWVSYKVITEWGIPLVFISTVLAGLGIAQFVQLVKRGKDAFMAMYEKIKGKVDKKEVKKAEELINTAQKKNKPINEAKKPKKESADSKLSEIEKNGKIATLEIQIEALEEIIEAKNQRIAMVTEDENLSELVDKVKVKEMQREVKDLEKKKMKMEKLYEKMCGKTYAKKEVVDEVNINPEANEIPDEDLEAASDYLGTLTEEEISFKRNDIVYDKHTKAKLKVTRIVKDRIYTVPFNFPGRAEEWYKKEDLTKKSFFGEVNM